MSIRVAALAVAALAVAAGTVSGCTVSVDGTGVPAAGVTAAPTATRASASPVPPPTVPPAPTTPTAPTTPAVTPSPRDPLALPAKFGGNWRGLVTQPGSAIPKWTAVITISTGETRGSFTVQNFCSGFADVVAVSGTKLVLLEEITSDPSGKCADRGVIELVPVGKNRLRMIWTDAAQNTNVATGILTRA